MIIIFSDCGFIIVAIIFFLCGSYKVGEVIADFIVDNCYIILVVLLIATFLISLYSVRDNYSKSVQITATIGFTILDFAKMLILYLLIVTWAIDYAYFGNVIGSIVSLFAIPAALIFITCLCIIPTFALRLEYSKDGSMLNICLIMALDSLLTLLFIILVRFVIAENFPTTYSLMLSNGWWENILNIARK